MKVRIGYSTVTFTDAGLRLPAEMPMSEIKLKANGEDLGSSMSSAENSTAV